MKKVQLSGTIIAVILTLTLMSCTRQEKEVQGEQRMEEEKIVIETEEVVQRELSFPVHSAGVVSQKEKIKLSFKVGGIVESIYVDEGQAVKEGQILAVLNLSEIKAQVNKARSAHVKAVRDLERAKNLYADRVATLEQLQDAETAYVITLSELEVAEFNLKYSKIAAPSNGKILKRFVEVMELVSPGIPVFIFASMDKSWIIRFGVTDRGIVRLSLGDPADVLIDVFPEEIFSATVSEIAEAADPATGTFEVELEIDQGEYKLISGFIARVDIYPSTKQEVSLIPIAALVEGDRDKGFVFTVDSSSSKAVRLPVKIGRILNDEVVVTSGLENVKEVVTSGAQYLTDGSCVKKKRL